MKKNQISTSYKQTLKKPQELEKSNRITLKTNILKESCPKHVVSMKTRNDTFLKFLFKMQFSAILSLETYDL